MPEKKSISQDDKIWATLSYLWIFSIIVLAIKKDNDFIKFHASQASLLFILSFVMVIPILGQLVTIVLFIFAVIAMIKAYGGEKWELPIIAGVAKDFGNWLIKTLKI